MSIDENESKPTVLSVSNLTKRFGELTAVNKASFNVKQGEILGIIGPNGSGKTTLFNLISGVLDPNDGSVVAKRIRTEKNPLALIVRKIRNILKSNPHDAQNSDAIPEGENIIGYSPNQIVNYFGIVRTFQIVKPFRFLSAQNNIVVPHVPRKTLARPSTLKNAAVASLLDVDLGEKKNYPAAILPHGDLKRLEIARVLACEPQVLLLDEPFSGLSSEDAFRVTQLIKKANEEYGVTIILVEHKLKLLSNLVERIVVLERGNIIAIGTPEEISKNKAVIASYLGTEASLIVRSE